VSFAILAVTGGLYLQFIAKHTINIPFYKNQKPLAVFKQIQYSYNLRFDIFLLPHVI